MSKQTVMKQGSQIEVNHNDEYMSSHHEDFFKSVLEDWRDQIISAADETLSNLQQRETYTDEVDIAVQEEAFGLELQARKRGKNLLGKINASLSNIKNGEYGYCQTCGIEIGLDRLKVRPTASKCVECQTIAELKEKHMVV